MEFEKQDKRTSASFSLDPKTILWLDKTAEKHQVSRSQVVEHIVKKWIKEHTDVEKTS